MATAVVSNFSRPPEWSDEDRMYYLMAPFPPNTRLSRSDSKVAFWWSFIKTSSKELRRWVFTERDLINRFKYKGSEPKCLKAVLECLEKAGEARNLSSYREGGWVNWGIKVLTSPMLWAWKRYVSAKEEEFILVDVVKELVEVVLTEHYKTVNSPTTDCIMTCESFKELCRKSLGEASSKDYRVVELQLLEDCMISKYQSDEDCDLVVVKFASSRNQKVTAANELDAGILSVKETLASLQRKVEKKAETCANLKMKALQFQKANQKTQAERLLRQFKMEQKMLFTVTQQLENLVGAFNQIQMAETNAKVFKAYESSLSVLRNIKEESDVTVDKVEDIMDNMYQLVAEGDDITNALAQDLNYSDEEELQLVKELEALKIKNTCKPACLTEEFPSMPTSSPKEREKLSKPDRVKKPVMLS